MDNFDEYIRQGEPSKAEKAKVWKIAVGLQQVDRLKPSEYLIKTAKQNIEGDITIDEVKHLIDTYYKQHPTRTIENRTEEADKVSARIAESLKATLEYDFEKEKEFSYKGLNQQEVIEHIMHFISYLWQIHVFGEGNTRTTAVFLIKYLRTFGFNVNNDLFTKYSWYFRNALVRANYKDYTKSIHATSEFLLHFLENLLLGENHILKNREMHVLFADPVNDPVKPIIDPVKPINDPVNDLVKDSVKRNILHYLNENLKANYSELADKTGYSTATIKRHIQGLKKMGILKRVGSDKTGYWKIME